MKINDLKKELNNLQPHKTKRQYSKTQKRNKQKEPAAINELLPVFGFELLDPSFHNASGGLSRDKNVWIKTKPTAARRQ